ncbi:hypothetical protein GWR56_06635 [Mucilaginibacter sp. 14171R-50]|jgi:hypothetical protein|uniref:hypothetical protein n=1 Tax=Mucilaginibacter sp. 14171R-50 TaxID=2703789 RepID=UPI00138CDDA0|nr:hypothetical protein [Mucilaginibacter sp. 14171R-50]QHS55231.1 hypothetical protein GWR56_06635 [Mucilaginibacter sp. 14171R-50]
MGFLSLILRVFKIKPTWKGTPEMFLAMVLDMQRRNNPVYSLSEVLQWGEVLQKVIKVQFKPFRDFPDLLQRGMPDYSLVEKVGGRLEELHQRQELKKAIYGEKTDLGDDDVMTSNSEGAVFARKMVKDLSKYVDFPENQ